MPTKKKPTKAGATPPVTSISNNMFTVDNNVNEFTRGAIIALASAAEANANAISEIAMALQTPVMGAPMINISGGKP